MPRLINRRPKYRLHKASGQAGVSLGRRDHYLGPWNTKASRAEYDRLVGEWLLNGRRAAAKQGEGPMTPSHVCRRRKREPRRAPGDRYFRSRAWRRAFRSPLLRGIVLKELSNRPDQPRRRSPDQSSSRRLRLESRFRLQSRPNRSNSRRRVFQSHTTHEAYAVVECDGMEAFVVDLHATFLRSRVRWVASAPAPYPFFTRRR